MELQPEFCTQHSVEFNTYSEKIPTSADGAETTAVDS
jgi:hypothetical protein